MPDKTYPGPFKGSRYTQYKKDPIKGYSRDLILKSGVVHHDTSGEFSQETQERKRRSRADAEKRVGWASKDGLEHLGKGLMITGGATGAVAAWGIHQTAKNIKRKAAERAYKQQDQAGRSASLAKGRDRYLPSATRQQINDAVTRNPDAPKDTSVRKDMGGGRRVRPVAGTPRIRLTQEQINERVARTRKGTEPMAERAPIQPGRRILNQPPSGNGGNSGSSTKTPKTRIKPGKPTGRIKISDADLGGFPARRINVRGSSVFLGPEGTPGSVVNRSNGVKVEPYNPPTPSIYSGKPGGSGGFRAGANGAAEAAARNSAYPPKTSAPAPTPPARTPKVFYHPETGEPLTPRTTPAGRPGVRSGQGMQPRPEGRAPGVAVNRNPITTEQQQAIASARNARRAPAPTAPAPTAPAPTSRGPRTITRNGQTLTVRTTPTARPGIKSGVGMQPRPEGKAPGVAVNRRPLTVDQRQAIAAARTGRGNPTSPGTSMLSSATTTAASKTAQAASTAGKGARIMGAVKKYGKLGGTIAGVAAGLAGASELYDRLAPKDWARAPWMSRGKEPVRAPQVTREQPFTPYPGGTPNTGGSRGGGNGGGSTMTQQARASQRAIRKPDDYLGEAFDATLRKGVDKGTAHLEHMMKMDNLDEDTRASLRDRFKKVQNDKILSQQKDKGIVERLDAEKAGRGENLLKAYRKEGGFNYGKGGKYEEIKRLAEKGTEYAAQ